MLRYMMGVILNEEVAKRCGLKDIQVIRQKITGV